MCACMWIYCYNFWQSYVFPTYLLDECVYHLGHLGWQKHNYCAQQLKFMMRYKIQSPFVLYDDKLLLAISNHSEFVITFWKNIAQIVSKGVDITTTFYGLFINVMYRLRMDKVGII